MFLLIRWTIRFSLVLALFFLLLHFPSVQEWARNNRYLSPFAQELIRMSGAKDSKSATVSTPKIEGRATSHTSSPSTAKPKVSVSTTPSKAPETIHASPKSSKLPSRKKADVTDDNLSLPQSFDNLTTDDRAALRREIEKLASD